MTAPGITFEDVEGGAISLDTGGDGEWGWTCNLWWEPPWEPGDDDICPAGGYGLRSRDAALQEAREHLVRNSHVGAA